MRRARWAPPLRRRLRWAVLPAAGVTALAVLTGCSFSHSGGSAASSPSPSAKLSASPSASPSPTHVDPASVHANELGQVPVLMIHEVEKHGSGAYWQTPAELRKQLVSLATHGYVPVTAADLVAGKIDVPAGKSPVVLTFDDAYTGQFDLGPDGKPKPGCAVGILLDVAKKHPDFTPVATFYLNEHPFGQDHPARYLRWLKRHGFDLGNHTYDHVNLASLDATSVQKELAKEQQLITKALPGYHVHSMALPLGAFPQDEKLALHGSWHGISYDYGGVMNVGAGPAPSPYDRDWKPGNVQRLRSAHNHVKFDAAYWLPKIYPNRYISDGDPDTISFPKDESGKLAGKYRAKANPY
jgi:peptidoglycan/xylan/chitin deacetylase (PgdA/CDA1 family)